MIVITKKHDAAQALIIFTLSRPRQVRRLGLVPQTQTGNEEKFVMFVDQVLISTDILPLLPKQRVGVCLSCDQVLSPPDITH